MPDGNKDASPGLLKARQIIEDAFGGLTGYAFAALAVVTSMAVAVMVAWHAAFKALRARYPRRLLVAGWLPLFYGLALILLALAHDRGSHRCPCWTRSSGRQAGSPWQRW